MEHIRKSIEQIAIDFWTSNGITFGQRYQNSSFKRPEPICFGEVPSKNVEFIAESSNIVGDPFISTGLRINLYGRKILKNGTPGSLNVIYS